MSFRKWLNDHNLVVSAVGVTFLVMLLNLTALGLHQSFTKFPYYAFEMQFQDWVARVGDLAPKDERIYFLYDDAASHNLSQLWDEDFEAFPILRRMKARAWPREVFAAILDRLASAGAAVVGFDYVFQGENTAADPTFRELLDRYKGQVVLGS